MAETFETVFAREFKKFETSLKKLERLTMDDSGATLRKYSSIFAAHLVRQTQPKGAAKKAQAKGQNAIEFDLRRVYVSPSTVYLEVAKQGENLAKAMWQQYKDNDLNGFTETMRQVGGKFHAIPLQPFDGGRAHQKARGSRGRVRGRDNARMVKEGDADKVGGYIRDTVRKVGYTKAGWISGFNPVGGIRGVPKWVLANRGRQGKVVDQTRQGITRAIDFYNHVDWIKDKFWKRGAQNALNSTARKMAKDLEKLAVEASKKV